MTILISVVIPVYNRTWQLRRSLQSLVDQTFRQFEVVVCDDGSTDDVRSIVAEFEGLLPIEFIRIENFGGPARPRNTALSRARGEWISFLDSDDWWDSHRMEAVAAALNKEVDLLYHSLRYIGSDGRSVRRGMSRIVGFPMQGDPLRYMALFGNPIPTSAAVVRRSILEKIGGMSEEPNLYDDFDAWLRLAEIGARIYFLEATLGSYWISDDAISAMTERQINRLSGLFNRHLPYFGPFEKEARARYNYTLAGLWFRIGRRDIALYSLRRAVGLPTAFMRAKRLLKMILFRFGSSNK